MRFDNDFDNDNDNERLTYPSGLALMGLRRWLPALVGLTLLLPAVPALAQAEVGSIATDAFSSGPPPWMDPTAPPPAPTPLGPPQPFGSRGNDGAFTRIHFDDLANYRYQLPTEIPAATGTIDDAGRIPAVVKGFGGHPILIDGYMLPLNVVKGKTTRFLLLRNTLACCYGTPPEPNEWILVDAPDGLPPLMDLLVEVYGHLSVEERWESGYLLGLYHLRASRLTLVRQSGR